MFRRRLDSFLVACEKFGTTGYPELLRFKGLIGRIDALDRALARHPDPALHEQVESLAVLERRLSAMANSVPSVRDAAKTKAWRERYAALGAERELKTRELAQAFAPFRETLEGKEAGLAEVQQGLAAQEVLLDVLLSHGRYLAFVVGHTGEIVRLDLGEATKVEAAAEAFVQASQRRGIVLTGSLPGLAPSGPTASSDTAAWVAAGQALRELVFAPVEVHLPSGTRTLYLVPDGALAAVPFAALPGRKAGRLLIDDYHLTHLSMAQELVPGQGASAPGEGALLIGGVDYDVADALESAATPSGSPATLAPVIAVLDRAPRGGRFDPLAATGGEVEGLAKQLGDGATVLLASQATESRLRSLAVGKRMLHFATHGFVRTDLMIGLRARAQDEQRWLTGGMERHLAGGHDPMLLAGLAMAGANPREGADGDDGILTAAEASYMDLQGCDLVVLSACDSAMGTPESGEGVLGLVHGFELAGAKSVVGSLWKVDDDATRLLMEKLYEGFLKREQPLSPAEALREAAIWLRDSKPGGHDYSAPRYWAAFVAYGR
jgi:CHAT domain-containing protein